MAICHDICPFRRTRNNGFLQKQTTSRARTHQKICRSLLLHKSCYEPQTFIMSYPRIFCIWTIFFKHWLANQYFRFVNSHAFQCKDTTQRALLWFTRELPLSLYLWGITKDWMKPTLMSKQWKLKNGDGVKSKTKDKDEKKHIFLIIASFWVYYLLNGFLHKGASQFGECQ